MSNVIDVIYWCDKKRDIEKKWGILNKYMKFKGVYLLLLNIYDYIFSATFFCN